MEIGLVTYVVAGTVAGVVVDGPAAGSGAATAALVVKVDVLLEESVFLKTVFILMSSFFPALFTLSSRLSAGAPPTLEAILVDVQIRWPLSQRRYLDVTGRGRVVGCDPHFISSRSRYSLSAGQIKARQCSG